MITFNSNFPGGNGKFLNYSDDGDVETITIFAEQKLGEPAPMWFCFDIDGIRRSRVEIAIANAHQFLIDDQSIVAFENCTPVYRGKDGIWKRAHQCKVQFDASLMPRISFEIDCKDRQMRVAFCFPYTMTELEDAFPADSPFQQTVIGYSTKGRPIFRYRAVDEGKKEGERKRGVFITCRQHAGEVGGSWMLDGMIRWLSDPKNSGWQQNLEIWIVPFVDTDGVEEGCYGKDQKAGDMNRAWVFPFSPRTEISAIIQDVIRWKTKCIPFLHIDMHSPACEVLEVLMNIEEDELGTNTLEWSLLKTINNYAAEEGLNLVKPNCISSSYLGSSQGTLNRAITYFNQNQIPNALFEVTYQGDLDGKRYEIRDYQCYGACLARALLELCNHAQALNKITEE